MSKSETPYVTLELAGANPASLDSLDRIDQNQNTNNDGMGPPKHADLESVAGMGSISSTQTAEGIHDPLGYLIVCGVILIGDMSRGVMFPTMWPLVESLGGTTVTLGYAVASFSFGRIIVSPVFGSWSVTYGYQKTLMLSTFILTVGTLAYAQIPVVGKKEFLIIAQTMLGIGSGTLGVTRAFVAEVTATRQRTKYMAITTAVQYGGFTVTPFFGALFSHVIQDESYEMGIFQLNKFTAPAYFMFVICFITLILLIFVFQDRERSSKKSSNDFLPKSKRRTLIDELANTTTWIGLTTYDACLLGCMLLNVATKGSIASFETMGINYADTHFGMSSEVAGSIVATCGTIGVVALLCMAQLSEYFTDVQLITGGMAVMVGCMLSLCFVSEDTNENEVWKYFLAMFMMYSVGYPIGHTAVIGMFSKIVGRRKQGTLMGWFASSGSAARILFPIMSGYVTNYSSIITLFLILIGILSTSMSIVVVYRKTLGLLSI
mmetsp:Transcript_209/g.295  ORF Transcript_209/g.295 Transcript_209/m.295 type:complete len:491 (+) Transcript_209:108-1580(+)